MRCNQLYTCFIILQHGRGNLPYSFLPIWDIIHDNIGQKDLETIQSETCIKCLCY